MPSLKAGPTVHAGGWCALIVLRQPLTHLVWAGAVLTSLSAGAASGHGGLGRASVHPGWILVAMAWGAWFAVWRLGEIAAWLGTLPAGARLRTELCAVGCALGVVSAPVVLARLGLGGGGLLGATAVAVLHHAALGAVLLRLPLTPRTRLLLQGALVWILPALWFGDSGWRGAAARLASPAGLWSLQDPRSLTLVSALVDMAPVAALLGAAWLVLTSNPRRQCATAS